MRNSDIQHRSIFLLKMLGVAVLYALFAHIAHLYVMSNGNGISVVWPSSGLALAALLIGGKRYAWSVFIGSLLMANVMAAGALVWADVAIASGNALAALLGAWLLTRNGRFEPAIGSLRDFLRLILLGGCAAGMVSALAGNAALLASGFIGSGEYFYNLLRWWMGDVLGVILITPLILSWRKIKNTHEAQTAGAFEAVLLFGLMLFIGQIVFLDWLHDSVGHVAKGYWMFLFITWVAVRLGVRGVTVALFMTAVQALWGAYHEVGYFEHDLAETQLANFWLYMVTLSIVGMVLATYFAERKQSEDTLRKLSLAVEQSPNSVVITGLDANIEYVNQAFVRETGYSFDEAIGQNPRLLSSGKNPKAIYGEMWAYLVRGETWKGELINRRKDGSEYIESVSISPVRQGNGQITHYLATKENITRRKNNEEKIERLSRVYRLLSQVNEAIVRAKGREELFAAICSAAVESELFRFVWVGILDEQRLAVIPVAYAGVEEGYTDKLNIRLDDERTGNGPTGRAIREDVYIICHDIENDPSMAPWRDAALKRGYRTSGVFPIHEAASVVGAINVYAADAHFFTQDIIQLMLELAADVSFAFDVFAEKKRRELAEDEIKRINVELERRVLERTRQLEAVNKELEAFCYSVSHDLRTPLRSIDGFSQILLKKYHVQLDEMGKDYLERVRRASQRMGYLIDDMLQLSQVTRGSLKREQVDLSRIAEEVADDLRKTHPERQMRFTLQQGLFVHADAGLLRIVMDNLLGNACKYTGKKTEAEIEFGMRDKSSILGEERTFFVRDNGAGFNMDYAHKLFGAFQRLHGANEFEGTGIGLATVQRIIHRHHGKVWAEAKEGQGATFYFTLPQREREA